MAKGERAISVQELWDRVGRAAAEYKLDGLRIQAHIQYSDPSAKCSVKLFSRGLEDVSHMYPDVIEGLMKQIKKNAVVEGEMIAVGRDGKFLPFQEIMQRKRKYDISEMTGKVPLVVYLFDILVLEDKSVMHEANEHRWKLLEGLVKEGNTVRMITRTIVESPSDVNKFFEQALKAGTEGIFVKKLTGIYRAGGRDFNWIKYKKSYDVRALSDTIDAVVMGYDVGQGKRSQFGIGDFLIGAYEPKTDSYLTVAKIGTGLTDEEWHRMKKLIDAIQVPNKPENYQVSKTMEVDVWCKPKIVVEIQADEITKSPTHTSGYALRFPRLTSWREKKPEDATTVDEIVKMLHTQRK